MRTLVKLGGRAVEDPTTLAALAAMIAATPDEVLVVHGGGHRISARLEREGTPVSFVDGLRVTSEAVLDVVVDVLCNEVNAELVAGLTARGARVHGLAGGLLTAELKGGGRWGRVGAVTSVDPGVLAGILAAGVVPVVAPVAGDGRGGALNVNADEAALALARSAGVGRLYLVSDVPGVLDGGEPVHTLDPAQAALLLDTGVVTGGMAVKLGEALEAAEAGIEVVIGDATALSGGAGTRVVPATASVLAASAA